MANYQLGITPEDEEIALILRFLNTLSGQWNNEALIKDTAP
jgi:hypothetical protein